MISKKKYNKYDSPLTRLASIFASLVLVINLFPAQGLAEAQEELAGVMDPSGTAEETTTPNETDGQDDNPDDAGGSAPAEAPSTEPAAEATDAATEQSPAEPAEEPATPADTSSGGDRQSAEPTQPQIPSSQDLGDFIVNAAIEDADQKDGAYVVDEGEAYAVKLTFAERGDLQFANDRELTFALPEEFVPAAEQPAAKEALFAFYHSDDERLPIELGKESWWVDGNTLHVAWKVRDADNRTPEDVAAAYDSLFALTDLELELVVQGSFAAGAEAVDFGAGSIAMSVVPKQADSQTKGKKDEAKDKKSDSKKDDSKQDESKKDGDEKPEQEATNGDSTMSGTDDASGAESTQQGVSTPKTTTNLTADMLTYEDAYLTATATLERGGALPAGTTLRVAPITQDDATYAAYLDALNTADGATYTAQNTMLYDIAFMADGVEVQPRQSSVSVSIAFKGQQLQGEIGASVLGQVEVTHLPMAGNTPLAERLDASVSVLAETARFSTSSFSAFAFSYRANSADGTSKDASGTPQTDDENSGLLHAASSSNNLADFITSASIQAPTNNDGYVMKAGDTYSVSLSFAEDATQFPNDGSTLTYSLPSNLKVAAMDNPSTFKIKVTDDNGTVYTLDGNTYQIVGNQLQVRFNSDNSEAWHKLTAANNARFSVSFDGAYVEETTDVSFGGDIVKHVTVDNSSSVSASKSASFDLANNKVHYQVSVVSTGNSTNVHVKDAITDQKGALSLDSSSIHAYSSTGQPVTFSNTTVNGNTFDYTIPSMKSGEVITFTYDANIDPTKIPAELKDGKNVQVETGTNTVEVWNEYKPEHDTTTVQTTIDYTPKIRKDGMTLNEDGKTFDCSFTFNEDASVSGASHSMTDTLGDHLTFEGTTGITVTAYPKGSTTAAYTETIAWGQTGTHGNSVTKTADNKFEYHTPASDTGNYTYVVTYQAKVTGTDGAHTQITVNNTVVTDGDKQSTGTGIWTPTEGEEKLFKTADNIDYENKEIAWTITLTLPQSATDWSADDVNLTDILPGGQWISGHQVYDTLAKADAEDDSDSHRRAVAGDANSKKYKVTVAGLRGDETWSVTEGADHKASISFTKNGTDAGLASGAARTITVKLRTAIDDEWLAAAAKNSYLETHTNQVRTKTLEAPASVTVAGVGVNKSLKQVGTRTVDGVELPVYYFELELRNVTSANNTIHDYFDTKLLAPFYTINDSDGRNKVVDGFEPYYFAWHTTNPTYGTNIDAVRPVTYVNTADGMDIITTADSMVTDPSSLTGFYPITKIGYYLTVKDEAALRTIQSRAANDGGVYTITTTKNIDGTDYTGTNIAEWNNTIDPAEVTYEYPGIQKKAFKVNEDGTTGEVLVARDINSEDADIFVDFELDINTAASQINNGAPLPDIVDTNTNLSVDITSVKVCDETGAEVTQSQLDAWGLSYDMEGDVLTFKNVPDATHLIIKYRGRVKFDSTGSMGETVSVAFSNTVTMGDYSDKVNKNAHRKNTGAGAAEIYSVKLMKYETGNMSRKLPGAVFQLFNNKQDPSATLGYVIDESNPVKDGSGKVVTFTTDDDGLIEVKGDEDRDGWSIHADRYYFLKETKAPADHKLSDFDYAFKVSSDGTTNYSKYIYHSGDTMSAKNTPGTEMYVQKFWGGGYVPKDTDFVIVQLQQQKLVKNGTGIWESPNGNNQWSDTVLKADGTEYPESFTKVRLDKDNNWEHKFEDLPVFVTVGGEDIKVEYQIKERGINSTSNNADTTTSTAMHDDSNNTSNNQEFTWHYGGTLNARTVTNYPKTGSLRLTKEVTVNDAGTTGTLADGTYNFTVTGKDELSDVQKSVSITIADGRVSEATIDGEAVDGVAQRGYVEIGGLSVGTYVIAEDDQSLDSSMELTSPNNVEVTVEAGKTGEAAALTTFTNNRKLGGLRIVKAITENGGTPTTRGKAKLAGTYDFGVYTDSACSTVATTADGTSCTGSITIDANGSATSTLDFENLPAGTYYVKETGSNNGVTLDATVHTVSVVAGKTASQTVETITNTYDTGSLMIKKNVTVNGVPAAQTSAFGTQASCDGTYTFQIWKGGFKTGTQVARVRITFANGVASEAQYEWIDERTTDGQGKNVSTWHAATIDDQKNVIIPDLVPGTYVVHELEGTNSATGQPYLPAGMYLVGGNGQGGNNKQVTVVAGQTAQVPTAELTNNRDEVGELELSKQVVSKSPALASQTEFTFTVTMYTDAAHGTVDTSISGNYGEMYFDKGVATVKLTGGQTKTAGNLPTGRYYRVTEQSATGWTLDGTTDRDGTITKTKSQVEFTNKLDEGDLEVKKTVASNFATDNNKLFDFTVTLLTSTGARSTLSGTYGTGNTAMTFNNGVASFKLKHGESRKAVGLPASTKYIVEEKGADGFTTTWSGDTGTTAQPGTIVKDQTKSTTATNERSYGDLKVSKELISTAAADTTEFTFKVVLSDTSINGTFGSGATSMKFTNGVATFTLTKGAYKLATGLPAGITYVVTETKAEGYTLTGVTGDMGTISTTQSEAKFENTRDEGGLNIHKRVMSAASSDKSKYYTFKITLYSNSARTVVLNDNNTYGDMKFTNGVAYVLLTDDQSATGTGIPVDTYYTIEEVSTTAETVAATRNLTNKPTDSALFANISDYNKAVVDGSDTALLPVAIADGVVQRGRISTATSSWRYTNTRKTGDLTVSKTLISDAAADKSQDFTFTVKLYKSSTIVDTNVDTSISGKFGDMTFSEGVATVDVKGGASVKAQGLPDGLYYSVTEASTVGFTLTGDVMRTGQVRNTTPSTVVFSNTRETGKIVVSKQVVSDAAADASQTFTFTVKLSDSTINGAYAKNADGTNNTSKPYGATFKDGEATVTVTGSGSATIDNLPTGVEYRVTEDNAPGFALTGITTKVGDGTAANGNSGVVAKADSTVTFTNARETGDLVLTKEVVSKAAADQGAEFELTVKLYGVYTDQTKTIDTTIQNSQDGGVYKYPVVADGNAPIVFSGGIATVVLNKDNNWTASARNLPTGLHYEVTETKMGGVALGEGQLEANGWKLTGVTGTGADLKSGTSVYGKTGSISTVRSVASFTNERQTGKLTISKELFSQQSADKDQTFTFTIKLFKSSDTSDSNIDTGINGTFGGVAFANGVGTVTLKGGASKTIDGLPRGMYYTVAEDTVEGYAMTGVTGENGTIGASEATAVFKNQRKYGGLKFTKAVSGLAAPDQTFTFTLRLKGALDVNGTGFTDQEGQKTYGTYRENNETDKPIAFNSGVATFRIRAGQTVEVQNLPLGVRYTLSENSANGFVTTVDGTKKDGEADATNVGDWYYTMSDGKVSATNYVGEVSEATGDPATFAGPTFTNTHEEGGLIVHKTVASSYDPDKAAEYSFRVELSNKSVTAVDSASATAYSGGYAKIDAGHKVIPFVNGVATFTLKDGDYASITGLPADTLYTVTETSVEGITTTWSDVVSTDEGVNATTDPVDTEGKGMIVANEVATTTATNTREYGRLAVTKQVVSHTPSDKDNAYGFQVTFYTEDPSKTYAEAGHPVVATDITGDAYQLLVYDADGKPVMEGGSQKAVPVTDGVATFSLKDGETAAIAQDENKHLAGLPMGIYYETIETDNHGLSTTTKLGEVKNAAGQPYDNGKIRSTTTSRFTNMQIEGGLSVYKNVNSHVDADKSKTFEFRVTLYTADPTVDEGGKKVLKSEEALKSIKAANINGKYGTDANALVFSGGEATATLKDGEFRYAINLPSNMYYTVMEKRDGEFNVTTSGPVVEDVVANPAWTGEYGQISANGNRSVTVTNTRKAGNLKVTKAPAVAGQQDIVDEYSFTVELEDKTINGTFGDMTFTNGVATFTLGKGESASTNEGTDAEPVYTLPIGLKYRVTETNSYGYSTTWESKTWANNDEGETDPVTYTYRYDQQWEKSDEYSEIDGYPSMYAPVSETRTISWGDGKTSVATNADFADDAQKSWNNGDHSTEWAWRQTDADGKYVGEVLVNAITPEHTDEVTFANTLITGTLGIYKMVDSPVSGDVQKFHFHVQLFDKVADGVYGDMYFENGVGYTVSETGGKGSEGFDLKAGDVVIATGVPKGARYEVTEDASSDFQGSPYNSRNRVGYYMSGEEEIIADAVREAQFPNSTVDWRTLSGYRNMHLTGELRLSKKVESELQSDKEATYTFSVKLADETYASTFAELTYNSDLYDYTPDPSKTYTFANGELNNIQLKDGEYVYFYKDDPSFDGDWKPAKGEHALVPVEEYKGSLLYNEMNGLPRGVNYTITETGNNGLTDTWVGNTGTISTTTLSNAECTNTREGGNLTVSKELVSAAAADKDQAFTFTVKLYTDQGRTQPAKVDGVYGDMTFAGGVATVQLTGGNSATATSLPDGVYYTVTEASATGFTLTGRTSSQATPDDDHLCTDTVAPTDDDAGGSTAPVQEGVWGIIDSTTPSAVTFTNERVRGVLRIGKQVNSEASFDNGREFTFTVRLLDTSINTSGARAAYTPWSPSDKLLVFTNGSATVKLKDGEFASIEGLPTDVGYTVTEDTTTGFEQTGVVTKDIKPITINQEGKPDTITNKRTLGGFKLAKNMVSDYGVDAAEEFAFTIRLFSDATATTPEALTGTYGDVTFANGVASNVTLSQANQWSVSATGLPTDLYYTITEEMTAKQQHNFTLTNPTNGQVFGPITASSQDQDATSVTFTNERIYHGDLVVTKNVVNPVDDDATREFLVKVTMYTDWTRSDVAEDMDTTLATQQEGDKPLEFQDGVAYVLLKSGERASAVELPVGLGYEVAEVTRAEDVPAGISYTPVQSFTPSVSYTVGTTAVTTDEARTIPRDAVTTATVSNSREFVDASVAKVWDEANSSIASDKSVVPPELKVTLNRNGQAYKEVTLNAGNSWTADVSQLPKVDESGVAYTYAWAEQSVDGWSLSGKTYTNNGQAVTEEVTNEAGLLTTLTNTVDVGGLRVTKHFADFDLAALSAEELNDIVFTIADADGKTVRTNTLANFAVATGETDPSWTVEGLPVGTYTVTETNNLKKYNFATTYVVGEGAATTKSASAPVAKGQVAQVNVTNTYTTEKPASLIVKKTVSSSRSQDKTREYAFKVTLDDKTVTGTYGDMKFTKGVATFKLKHGESKKATGLPLNEKDELGYQIAETDTGGLISTMGKPVKSKDGLTHTVTCTNTYTPSTPTTPTSKTTTSGASRIATAQTGDATSLWAVAALVAAGGASTVAGVLRRRRSG